MKTRILSLTSGLVTEPGTWSRDEESLADCLNLDLSAPGLVAKRRGLSSATIFTDPENVWAVHSSPTLESEIGAGAVLVATGTSTGAVANRLRVGLRGAACASLATVSGTQTARLKLATMTQGGDVITATGGNFDGLLVPNYTGLTTRHLGVPRGMGLDRLGSDEDGVTGFLPIGYSCRYAVTFSLGDPTANGTQEGSPGMTSVFTNALATACNVKVVALLPYVFGTPATGLPADTYWVNVYRSVGAPSSLGEPPSELALVYRAIVTSTDIGLGNIQFIDIVPDQARGANLYTNLLSGEDGLGGRGFVNSNEPPPVATDVATWADCLWLGNLQDWPTQEIQLIAVGGSGLVATDTVTIDGLNYTAVAGAPAANEFQISGAGTASVNQRETALNLVDAINRSITNSSCYAYYVAGVVGQPGRIILKGRTASSNMSATTSNAVAFRVGTQTVDGFPSGIGFSKALQPHAHPVVNRFELGRGDAEVMRIIPYRDSLFVFKSDGLWRVTGTDYRNFVADEFDLTFKLIAREAVCQLDDAIYAWGLRGLARITDGGVEYIDTPIRNEVTAAYAAVLPSTMAAYAFCVPRPVDGVVWFFYPTSNPVGGDLVPCGLAFAWHARTQTWALLSFPVNAGANGYSCGTANVVDGIATMGVWIFNQAGSGNTYLHNERRAYAATDFTDPDMSNATTPTMSAQAVGFYAAWRPLDAGSLGAAQWMRARVDLSPADATRQTPSGSIQFSFAGDGGIVTSETVTPSVPAFASAPAIAVVPVGQDAARSHALQVVLQHSAAAGFWVSSVAVDFRDVSMKGAAR